ncbi:DNA repair protein recA, partial [Musa troglodytarum]
NLVSCQRLALCESSDVCPTTAGCDLARRTKRREKESGVAYCTLPLSSMARFLRIAYPKRCLFSTEVYKQGVLGTLFQLCNFSSKAKISFMLGQCTFPPLLYPLAKGGGKSKSNGSGSGEDNISKKDLALQQALDQITAQFGTGAIMWLGRSHAPREVPVVSTGSFALDIALGIGGLPKVVANDDDGGSGRQQSLRSISGDVIEENVAMMVVVCDEAVMVAATISANVWMRMVAPTEGGGGVSDNDRLFLDLDLTEIIMLFHFLTANLFEENVSWGRVVEIYGSEASGKTTLALHVIAESQKNGGYCAFVDAEHALDPSLAESIGVKTENLLLSQPDCGEQALNLVDTLIRSGAVDVVVVDSVGFSSDDNLGPRSSELGGDLWVAALVPKSELDGDMGDVHMALQARLMSQALRKLSHSLSLSQTILLFVNQVRSKLSTFGGFKGPTEVTCGGNALKFYASVRLKTKIAGLIKKGDKVSGTQIMVKIVKNKHAPPFKEVQLELEFGKGISRDSEVIELGCKHQFITKAGAAYYCLNGQNFLGKDALKRYFAENEVVREELMIKLKEKLTQADPNKRSYKDEISRGDTQEEIISLQTTDEEVVAEVEAQSIST